MAKIERGTFTVVSTGNMTVLLDDYTFKPDYIVMSVTTDSGNARSVGGSNATVNYSGNSGTYTDTSLTKSVSHYRNKSGTKTKVLEGSITAIASGSFTFNASTRTENTQVTFTAYGN